MCGVVFIAETTDIPFRQALLDVWIHLLCCISIYEPQNPQVMFGEHDHCSLSRFSIHIAEVAMDYGAIAMDIWTLAITLFSGFLSLDLHIDNDIGIYISVYWCTAIDQIGVLV